MEMTKTSEGPEAGNQSAPLTQRKSRFLSVVAVAGFIIGVVCLVLLIVVIVLISTSSPNCKENDNPSLSVEEKVVGMFPGYFRTKAEQRELEMRLNTTPAVQANTSSVDVPNNGFYVNASHCTANSKCTVDKKQIPIVPSQRITHHACCTSISVYITPENMTDIYGQIRTLAQFDDKRQYFQTERCMQQSGCTTCSCQLMPGYVTGVYVVGNGTFEIAWFSVLACCKCINT